MMLRCVILDDEPLAHKVIRKYMEDVPFLELSGQFYRAADAIAFLNDTSVDLLFLDIQMPKLNGLEFLKTLNRKPLVIITSAYEEYALQSFELDVCDYLLKPFRFDRFLKAVNKVMDQAKWKQSTAVAEEQVSAEEFIYVKSDKRFTKVELTHIHFLESYGNYVKVWLQDHFLLTARTLSSFENQLPPKNFIRIHKSYIINKKYVDYIEGNTLLLTNGQELPIGKNHKYVVKTLMGGAE